MKETEIPETSIATLDDILQPRFRRVQWRDPITGKWLFFQEPSAETWAQLVADTGEDERYLADFQEQFKIASEQLKAGEQLDEQKLAFLECYNAKSASIFIHRLAALSERPKLTPKHAAVLCKGLTMEQVRELSVMLRPLLILSDEAFQLKNSPASPDRSSTVTEIAVAPSGKEATVSVNGD